MPVKTLEPGKNIIIYIFCAVFFIPLLYENNLIDINTLQRLAFSVLTLTLIFVSFPGEEKSFRTGKAFVIFSIVYPGSLLLSSLINGKLPRSFVYIFPLMVLFAFAFALQHAFRILGLKKTLNYISTSIIYSGLVVSVIGVFQLYGINLFGINIGSRPGSTLMIRNFAAEYVSAVIPFVVFRIFFSELKSKTAYYSIIALIIVTYALLLRSRTAYLAIVACFLIFVIATSFKSFSILRKEVVVSAAVTVIVILISYLIALNPPAIVEKERSNLGETVNSIFDVNYSPNTSRLNYAVTSFKIFSENPIFGSGTGTWASFYNKFNTAQYSDLKAEMNSDIHPHNEFLKALSENGIMGFLIYTLFVIIALVKLFRRASADNYALPFAVSFLIIIFLTMLSFTSANISVMIIFYTCIAIAFYPAENETSYFKLNRNTFTVILFFLSLLPVAYSLFDFKAAKSFQNAMSAKAAGNYELMLREFDGISDYFYPADANNIPFDYYRGIGHYELKDYNKALETFNSAGRTAPYFPPLQSNIASAYYAKGDTEKAEEILRGLKREYPLYFEPQINLLAMYVNGGKDSLASELIKEIGSKESHIKTAKNYITYDDIKKYLDEKKHH